MAPDQLAHWEAILDALRASKPALASVYEHSAPLSVAPERIVLAYEPKSFLSEQASEAEARKLLSDLASAHFGADTAVEIDVSGRHHEVQSVAAKNSAMNAAAIAEAKKKVADHPLVRAAVNMLGAELRDVRLPGDVA